MVSVRIKRYIGIGLLGVVFFSFQNFDVISQTPVVATEKCALEVVTGPITVTATGLVSTSTGKILSTNGVISQLEIFSYGSEPAISVNGFTGVQIKNVKINVALNRGIALNRANLAKIQNVRIYAYNDITGIRANPSANMTSINIESSNGVRIDGARLIGGSSGVYLVDSPNAYLTRIHGVNMKGPFPRGQLVQFNRSDKGVLEDFSVINDRYNSYPEDNISVFQSKGVRIKRGMIDGNNSQSGVGVMIEQSFDAQVVDVDAVRMGNGCFSAFYSDTVKFIGVRCRDNICSDQGRGVTQSNFPLFGSKNIVSGSIGPSTSTPSGFYNLCNPRNIGSTPFTLLEPLTNFDFNLRPIQNLKFCFD